MRNAVSVRNGWQDRTLPTASAGSALPQRNPSALEREGRQRTRGCERGKPCSWALPAVLVALGQRLVLSAVPQGRSSSLCLQAKLSCSGETPHKVDLGAEQNPTLSLAEQTTPPASQEALSPWALKMSRKERTAEVPAQPSPCPTQGPRGSSRPKDRPWAEAPGGRFTQQGAPAGPREENKA